MASGNANAFFRKAIQGFVGASINWGSDTIKASLGRMSSLGKAVTGATNATPIVITSTAHGYANGDWVLITGVGGNTNANGVFKVANQAANTFELTDPLTGANIAGNAAYTSGGYVISLDAFQYVADLPSSGAGIIVRSSALASKTSTLGVLDAADVTFSAVSAGAALDAIVIFKDTGSDATSPLVLIACTATGLPVTPNGGDITITWDNGNFKIGMP